MEMVVVEETGEVGVVEGVVEEGEAVGAAVAT